MKKISIISAIVALALPYMAVAQTLPNKTLQDVSGKNVELKSLIDGKTPFVLSFWMTTCKPCMIELEALTDEIADWSESWPLRIYAVSVDDSRSLQRAVAMAQGRGWDGITSLFDVNGDLRRALNVSAVPQVFVYDSKGELVYTHIGYRPGDEAELLQQVKNCRAK